MKNHSVERVRAVVIKQIEDLTPVHLGTIKDSDRLLADLKLTGDDASVFAIMAMKQLGVKVPQRAWRQVITVGDAIELLASAVPSGDG